MDTRLIPRVVSDNELLVRCITSPLFHNGKKLRINAFLPPRKHQDVSLLRLDYTTYIFCKSYGLWLAQRINNQTYLGLACIVAGQARETILKISSLDEFLSENRSAILRATPMITDSEYYPEDQPVFTNSAGNPMHGDIFYDQAVPEDEPLPVFMKKTAEALIEIVDYRNDSQPELKEWLEGNFFS
jgi:hypothetical protein